MKSGLARPEVTRLGTLVQPKPVQATMRVCVPGTHFVHGNIVMKSPHAVNLSEIAQRSRSLYAERIAVKTSPVPWWTAVVLTASSSRQAESYRQEVRRREQEGKVPAGVIYMVVPDPGDQRIGSGGATLHALAALAAGCGATSNLEEWWTSQRVLMVHSGGDSRRLPQYSLSGKLFSALPVKTPWGEVSTVFDEMLALSTAWAQRLEAGLVVGSGDVILTFDAELLEWDRPGVGGVAMLEPVDVGTQHGVYVTDQHGRVYSFLQKPSVAEVSAAGGLTGDGKVALDIGLLRFAPAAAASLTQVAASVPTAEWTDSHCRPVIDLYQHFTMGLTGQWVPGPADHPLLHRLSGALRGLPFWCSVVAGDFTHVGTTTLFRKLLTEDTDFSRLYTVQQRLGITGQPNVQSAGVVVDSVFSGGEVGPGAVVIECNLAGSLRAARGAVLHGLSGLSGVVEVPEDVVLHQVPVLLPDGRRGAVIRVYGVMDDPKAPADAWEATWFGRPMIEELRSLGLDLDKVWPGLPAKDWSLWNAELFPVTTAEQAWDCALWLMHMKSSFSPDLWCELPRLSLATSAKWVDTAALEVARTARMQASWLRTALALAESGADIRPILFNAPGVVALAETGRQLRSRADSLVGTEPTEAARRYFQAGLCLAHAGLQESENARHAAFESVRQAVSRANYDLQAHPIQHWRLEEVEVQAPARIDLGGGWSDTPPFCLDWGGTVLNVAVELYGSYPIRTLVRRLPEPVVRCVAGEEAQTANYTEVDQVLAPAQPGDPFSIPRTALQMLGAFQNGESLQSGLERLGGGIEIRTEVNLPMGSGLGTSSILAATMLRALGEAFGLPASDQYLSDQVMRLEQIMTTGGGWQDQAGGIFPGAKLISSGPGFRQQLRIAPVDWTPERQAEFSSLMLLHYTGIQRLAKGLLQQVVGSYLARETHTVQVLHSIKTLAMEMAYAMREGEWDYLGELLDRHWRLNQLLDPNTANAPINAMLESSRPYIRGAKLAGAGGGGFLMLLARSPEAALDLQRLFTGCGPSGSAFYPWKIATEGLRVRTQSMAA